MNDESVVLINKKENMDIGKAKMRYDLHIEVGKTKLRIEEEAIFYNGKKIIHDDEVATALRSLLSGLDYKYVLDLLKEAKDVLKQTEDEKNRICDSLKTTNIRDILKLFKKFKSSKKRLDGYSEHNVSLQKRIFDALSLVNY